MRWLFICLAPLFLSDAQAAFFLPQTYAVQASASCPPTNSFCTLPIGAGGFLTSMDAAADGTMVTRTDTYGAYVWNATAKSPVGSTGSWQQLVTATSMPSISSAVNIDAQGVYEIQIAASNTSVFYMAYQGLVYKTTNKGTSWTQTAFAHDADMDGGSGGPNDPSYKWFAQKIGIDPGNANHVFVGTPDNGLLVSTDGNTFSSVAGVPAATAGTSISGILFDPGNTSDIYVSSFGSGIYESTNGGTSWTPLTGGPNYCSFSAISSGVYYCCDHTNLWKYSSGAWTEILAGSTSSFGHIFSVAVNPDNASNIIAADGNGEINESTNSGSTWTGWSSALNPDTTEIPWQSNTLGSPKSVGIYGIYFDPTGTTLYSNGQNDFWSLIVPGSVSGATLVWTSQGRGIEQLVANQVIVPTSAAPVLASWDRPFFFPNLSAYPSTYYAGIPAVAIGASVDFAAGSPSTVVGIADAEGSPEISAISSNGGSSWTKFAAYPTDAGSGSFIAGVISANSATNFFWAPSGGTQPYFTTNGGAAWTASGALPGSIAWNNNAYFTNGIDVAADRVAANTFYYFSSGSGSIFESTNSGATWSLVNSSVPGFGSYAQLQAVPGQSGNLFLSSGWVSSEPASNHFLVSTNSGTTWANVSNIEDVYVFGFGKHASGQTYPAIYIVGWANCGQSGINSCPAGASGYTFGLWRSIDDLSTWTFLTEYPNNSLDRVTTISGDMNNYGAVYVGFSGSGYAYGQFN